MPDGTHKGWPAEVEAGARRRVKASWTGTTVEQAEDDGRGEEVTRWTRSGDVGREAREEDGRWVEVEEEVDRRRCRRAAAARSRPTDRNTRQDARASPRRPSRPERPLALERPSSMDWCGQKTWHEENEVGDSPA
jgi:hypothetical protein